MEHSELNKAISVILSGLRDPASAEEYLNKFSTCIQAIYIAAVNTTVKKRFKQINAEILGKTDKAAQKDIAIKFLAYFAGFSGSKELPKNQLEGEFVESMGFYVKLTDIENGNTTISKELNVKEGTTYSFASTAILVSYYNNLVLVQELSISRPKVLVKNNIFIANLGNCFLVNGLYLKVVEIDEPKVSLELLREQIASSSSLNEEMKDSLVHVGNWSNNKSASYFLIIDYNIIMKKFANDPKQITIRWQNKNCIIQSEVTEIWRYIEDPAVRLNGVSKPLGFTNEISLKIGKRQYVLSYGKNK